MNFIDKIKNNPLFKVGASYSLASTCSSICTMIIGFLNMRWLGPELLGIWQSVTIINAYLPFFQLGIQGGLNLELPIMLGAKKESKALKLIATSYAFAISIYTFGHCRYCHGGERCRYENTIGICSCNVNCDRILFQVSFYSQISFGRSFSLFDKNILDKLPFNISSCVFNL